MKERRLFALDQNFPTPIVATLQQYMPEADLVAIADIHPRMPTLEDWQVLLALHTDKRPWDGLVTNDADMLALPKEMAVLIQTKLTLVIAEAAGHDPLRATGLVLTHLPWICKKTSPDASQVWLLRATQKAHEEPWSLLAEIGRRRGGSAKDHFRANKLSEAELSTSPLTRGPA